MTLEALDRTGLTIGLADPMIAAITLLRDLDRVTGNIRHYQRIQEIGHPLRLVNWRGEADPEESASP